MDIAEYFIFSAIYWLISSSNLYNNIDFLDYDYFYKIEFFFLLFFFQSLN